jgi:hypothetical protein
MNMGAVQSGRAGPIRDSLQTGGLFRKKAKFAAARHVPRGGLWCEQRRVGFNISDWLRAYVTFSHLFILSYKS